MKTRSIVWIIVIVIVVIVIAVVMGNKGPVTPSQTANVPQQPIVATPAKPAAPATTKPTSTAPAPSAAPVAQYYKVNVTNTALPIYYSTTTVKDMIKVQNPTQNTSISSPLTIGGSARGSWYSEGSAPVILTDTNGKIIAQGSVVAQGNWMTNDFVPFIANFTYPAQQTNTVGVLVFKNANPSGLPQNDKSVEVVVRFK